MTSLHIQTKRLVNSLRSILTPAFKRRFYSTIFICILVFGIVLRVNEFGGFPNFALNNFSDAHRDYLIAHHIIQYGEIPLTGPFSLIGTQNSSPGYYYLLAAFLAINDNIVFLSHVNILLQIFVLIGIYFLAKGMFSRETGLIAVALFSISPWALRQSEMFWAPYVMQPFFILSLFLLLYAYRKKSYWLLLASIIIFVFSTALHQSVFGLLPTYLFAIMIILRQHKEMLWSVAGALMTFIAALFATYFPVFLYTYQGHAFEVGLSSAIAHALFLQAPSVLVANFFARTHDFLEIFFARPWYFSTAPFYLVSIAFFIVLGIIYFHSKRLRNKKYLVLIIVGIIQFFFVVAMLSLDSGISLPTHYPTPILVLSIIFMAELIQIFPPKNLLTLGGKALIVLLMIYVLSPMLPQKLEAAAQRFRERGTIGFFHVPYRVDSLTEALKDAILAVQKAEGKTDLAFFQIKASPRPDDHDYIWANLEIVLDTKLVKVDDNAFRDYSPIATDHYIFVICPYKRAKNGYTCKEMFSSEYPNHVLGESFHAPYPYSIYLAERG